MRNADRDQNGFITRKEFKRLLHFLEYFNDIWHKFEAIDTDGDRRLSCVHNDRGLFKCLWWVPSW